MSYRSVLIERAYYADNGAKALSDVELRNHNNVNAFRDRLARHSLGLEVFHVEPSWFDRLLGRKK